MDGTLGYSGARTVVNRLATGAGSGGATSGSGGGASGGAGGGASGGSGATSGGEPSAGASSAGARTSFVSQQQRPDPDEDEDEGSAKGKGDGKGEADADRGRGDDPKRDGARASGNGGEGAKGSRSQNQDGGSRGGGGSGGGEAASQGSGTVTRLAREGSVVTRGQTLYELDDKPVVLMYGRIPAYRRLSTATTDGPDVRQLERNLVALGFGAGVTVDEHFSAATAAAVRRWQRSLGLPQTGAVELGRVVFLPGARRVGSHKAKVGSALGPGAEVLETTSTRRVVTVELEVSKQSLVRPGDTVTVTLPDGSTVRGRIARVGRVARKKDEGGGSADGGTPGAGGSGDSELVIDLTIVLRDQRGVARLDQAPVTVGIAQETKRNVLSVPVAALVARPGGGYGVEVVRGGRRRIVAVRTGLFAGGLVEISGRGIGAGTKVAIPAD